MKTSRPKADAESGERKEGSVLNFNDSSIRLSFVRKVYGLVFTQLAIILAFVLAFSLEDFNQSEFIVKFKWISCAGSFLVGIIIFLVLACSTAVRRTHPINLLLLAILSICEGWFIGALCSVLRGNLPTIGFGLAAAVVFGLTILTCSCKSLNFWWNLVALLLLLSTITPALALAFPSVGHAKLFYVAIGVFLFGLFLIVDLQRMTEGYYWNYTFDREEYILASLFILIDIMDCIIQLLRVLYICFYMFDSC